MAKKKKKSGGSTLDPNAWMATFSDLLMLMLTFFVLLLTMSTLEQQKLAMLSGTGLTLESPKVDTEVTDQTSDIDPYLITPPVIVPTQGAEHDLETKVEAILRAVELIGHAWIEYRPEGMAINVDGQIIFEQGDTRLTPRARQFLSALAPVIAAGTFNVGIEVFIEAGGHAIIRENRWDLALRRSDIVANYIIERNVSANRFTVMGYGYSAGRDESTFVRHSNLIRFNLLTGPQGAEAVPKERF